MKKLLSVILCICVLFCCAACGEQDDTATGNPNKDVKVDPAKVIENFDNQGTVIVCWGDNITQGMAMPTGYTYPQHLQASIGSKYRVLNAGVPGEACDAILSRANAIEFCLATDVIFEKGEAQYTMDRYLFTVPDADIPLAYMGFGNQLPLKDVIIGGKPYTIEFESGDTYDNGIYRITRKDASKALTIPAGTKVKFDYSSQYDKIYCNIILMGANDGNRGAETLIEKYKKLTALNENYIVIVPFYSSDYSKEFKEAFGDKALDVREYFMKQAHKDYGIELTKLDEACIKKGLIPGTYNYQEIRGDSNLNKIGYKILADQVYKKGVELGYWK
ncbi:MAG: hypothetical protein J6S00_03320 [Clostridia bacterium]|nr:hypothetical protein [Clostridia bacterium]